MREGGLPRSLCLRVYVLPDVVTGGLEMGFENQPNRKSREKLTFSFGALGSALPGSASPIS